MKTLVTYSSLTGNTKMVAEAIYEAVEGEKKLVSLVDIESVAVEEYDRIVVGFWVDKGTADGRSKRFIKSLKNKDMAYFGTLGETPESDHGKRVKERVDKMCMEKNSLLGGFLCTGKVDPKLVEKMGKFPLNLIHPLNPERLKRIENAKSHPNKEDLENAKKYFIEILK